MKIFASRPVLVLVAGLAFAAGPAGAQTLYKLISKDGKVTYAESPPKDFDGKVIRIDVDPKANTATLPKGSPAPTLEDRRAAQATAEQRVSAARAKLEAAQKALAEARDKPGEADIVRMGKKGGGTRPVPSEDYQRRLEKLERDVKDAEEALEKAQRAR